MKPSPLPHRLLVIVGVAILITAGLEPLGHAAVVHDLTPLHDAQRVLLNPHKGWYHHYPDNHINKYQIARDADLLEFPGMDHLYVRLAWAYLELHTAPSESPVKSAAGEPATIPSK